MELPEEKRPPRSMWDKPSQLDEWFDRVYSSDKQTDFQIPIPEDREIEK